MASWRIPLTHPFMGTSFGLIAGRWADDETQLIPDFGLALLTLWVSPSYAARRLPDRLKDPTHSRALLC